ncbi:hypothetical protein [Pseudaminobacter sp. NGMCC 1.201702]|uniref:hypothetical protein n=1 Tax=Pseudaminobacter sp. NGMCC 1.201702 TaxID=3391825 RepID=UPI0039EF576E
MPSKKLSYEEQAALADLIMIVKARFIEAADTMVHLDVGQVRPAKVRSLWPAFQTDNIGGHHPGYGINGSRVTYRPSSQAISRAEEVLYRWLLDFVETDEDRVLLGKWSICMAAPRVGGSFRKFCKKTGRSRSTAERRVDRAFKAVADAILKNAQSLQGPNWSRVMPMMPNQRMDFGKMASITRWMAPDAKPQHIPEMLDVLREKAA